MSADELQVRQVVEHIAQEPALGLGKNPASHSQAAGAVSIKCALEAQLRHVEAVVPEQLRQEESQIWQFAESESV